MKPVALSQSATQTIHASDFRQFVIRSINIMKLNADNFAPFFAEIAQYGYHIFSRRLAEQGGFYPNNFPSVPVSHIEDLKRSEKITIRAFFAMDKSIRPRIDSGYIDLEVEYFDRDAGIVFANILTDLPPTVTLSKGTTIELELDEILSRQPG